MSRQPPRQPQQLRIWQQNVHKSQTAQDYICCTTQPSNWNIIALQEPWINTFGNSRGSQYWRVIYPANFYAEGCLCIRSILLINSNISTNSYLILPIMNRDITAVRFHGKFSYVSIF